jgi:hypothetical protein
MRRCEHDARLPKPSCVHKVGPAGGPSSSIPPCRRLLVEPAPIRQAAEEDEVWAAATLAPSLSALEADVSAQLAPMRGIERPQLRADWHRLESRYLPPRASSGRPTFLIFPGYRRDDRPQRLRSPQNQTGRRGSVLCRVRSSADGGPSRTAGVASQRDRRDHLQRGVGCVTVN